MVEQAKNGTFTAFQPLPVALKPKHHCVLAELTEQERARVEQERMKIWNAVHGGAGAH